MEILTALTRQIAFYKVYATLSVYSAIVIVIFSFFTRYRCLCTLSPIRVCRIESWLGHNRH